MPSLNNLSMLVDLGIRKQRKTSSAMLFEELLTIIFCYYLHSLRKQLSHAIKDDTLSSSQQDSQSILYGFCKRYFAFLKKGRPIQVIIFNLQKKNVVPDLVIATGRPIQMVQILCNTDVILYHPLCTCIVSIKFFVIGRS